MQLADKSCGDIFNYESHECKATSSLADFVISH